MCICIVFLKKLRSLFLYLTYHIVQIFTTFNRADVSFLNKTTRKYGKRIALIFYIHCTKLEEVRVIIFSLFLSRFCSVSNAINFFIHSLNRFVLKKTTYALLLFFNWVPYMQTYLLNACKLDGEENLFDFYVESIAFSFKILINITSI